MAREDAFGALVGALKVESDRVMKEIMRQSPTNTKNPPPPAAVAEIEKHYETTVLSTPVVRRVLDGVVLSVSEASDVLLMTAKGARENRNEVDPVR